MIQGRYYAVYSYKYLSLCIALCMHIIYSCFTASKNLLRYAIFSAFDKTLSTTEETIIKYNIKTGVDIYCQAKIANKWLFDSLEFSILQFIPMATNNNNNLIDLACGSGIFCRRIANEYGYETIIGIDSSSEMIVEAKKLSSSDLHQKCITYKVDNCGCMDEAFMLEFEARFSVVTCQWLYSNASSIQELSQMIANAASLLKCGGIHIGCTINPLIIADSMTRDSPSEQWKEFGLEAVSNCKSLLTDGETLLQYLSIVELNDNEQHTSNKQIGINCIEFNEYFYTMKTYCTLFEEHGFCDIHWLTSDEHLAHPCLSRLNQEKYQRYVNNNPEHAIFVMRKK